MKLLEKMAENSGTKWRILSSINFLVKMKKKKGFHSGQIGFLLSIYGCFRIGAGSLLGFECVWRGGYVGLSYGGGI